MVMNKKRIYRLCFLLVVIIILAICGGYQWLSLQEVIATFTFAANDQLMTVMWTFRLPRIIVCLFAGSALAVSGLLLQNLTKNPLADSGILGINVGAGLIIGLVITLFNQLSSALLVLLPFFAMLGGCITVAIVFFFAYQRHSGLNPIRLIIAGVGISTLISGVMVMLTASINKDKVEYIVKWLSGTISGDNWSMIMITLPILIIVLFMVYRRSHHLNIMALNDLTIIALGLNLQKERIINLLLATALTAISVVLVGNIAFIGLIAGHLSRRLGGTKHQYSLIVAMLIGAILLISADLFGRAVLVSSGIPTGIIVAVLGAPYFLWLIYHSK